MPRCGRRGYTAAAGASGVVGRGRRLDARPSERSPRVTSEPSTSVAAPPASGAMPAREPESAIPASSRAAIDAALETLRGRKVAWAALPVLEKIDLLRALRRSFADVAAEWAAACQRAEGLDAATPTAGEEWITGPYVVLRNLRL